MTDTQQSARLDGILARYSPDGAPLTPADLPPGMADDLLYYRSTEGVRGRVLSVWLKAVAASKRSGALGIASDCTAEPAIVAFCRAGRYSRVVQIDSPPSGLVLEMKLAQLATLPA
jgi:hypothetical protein